MLNHFSNQSWVKKTQIFIYFCHEISIIFYFVVKFQKINISKATVESHSFTKRPLLNMESLGVNMKRWQKKRKWMFINMCIGGIAYGLSLNIYFPTEYYYLKNTVKIEDPSLIFGLAQAALFLSGAVSSIIGSYYVDLTNNYREICLLEDVLNIIGNIMYSLYYSPYLILFGQILIGTTAARMTSSVGEIARVYEPCKLTQKLGLLGVMTVLGSVSGPSTIFLFQYVDTSIGSWKWSVGNMVGIAMTGFYLLQFLLNYFTLYNVSKEFTLKKEHLIEVTIEGNGMEHDYEEERLRTSEINNTDKLLFNEKYFITLKALFQNKHIIFYLVMCIILTYFRVLAKLVVPIKGEEYFNWKQTDIAKLWVLSMITGAIPTMVVISILAKYVNDFFLYLSSLITLLLCLLLMGLLPMFKDYGKSAEVMVYFAMSLYLMSSSIFHILSRSMLAKFVPENVQSIMEGFRNALFEVAVFFGGLSVMLPVNYLSQTMFATAIITCILTGWYIAEKQVYRNTEVIDVKYNKIVNK